MKISEILKILAAQVLVAADCPEQDILMACGCDLMSDVLSFIKPGALLLTGLTNRHVVHTAEMAEVAAVCFVRGKQPPRDTVELAAEKHLCLLSTKYPMFEACGRLYEGGLGGCVAGK